MLVLQRRDRRVIDYRDLNDCARD